MEYLIKQGEFEGPIHLLLELIQNRKLHVSEISLALVAEDFLRYLSEHELSYAQVSSFVVVASTLVLMKARSLMPTLELTTEEETSIQDLTDRVRRYQVVQKFATYLAPRIGSFHLSYHKAAEPSVVFIPDDRIHPEYFTQCMRELFHAFPLPEKNPEKKIHTVIRLEEYIEELTQRIQSGFVFHSQEVLEKYRTITDPVQKREAKVFAVVSFLAMLELVKKGIGKVLQEDRFGDITFSQQEAPAQDNSSSLITS